MNEEIVADDTHSGRGQWYGCIGLALALGAMVVSRLLHTRDWHKMAPLLSEVSTALAKNGLLGSGEKGVITRKSLMSVLYRLFLFQITFQFVAVVGLVILPFTLNLSAGHESRVSHEMLGVIFLAVVASLVTANLLDEHVEYVSNRRFKSDILQLFKTIHKEWRKEKLASKPEEESEYLLHEGVKAEEFARLLGKIGKSEEEAMIYFTNLDVERNGSIQLKAFKQWFQTGAHHGETVFRVKDKAMIAKEHSSMNGKLCQVIDPDWQSRVKVRMFQIDGKLNYGDHGIKSYKAQDLRMVEAHTVVNSYDAGDIVRCIKSGSSRMGTEGRVTAPDWNQRVKVHMGLTHKKGPLASYRIHELELVAKVGTPLANSRDSAWAAANAATAAAAAAEAAAVTTKSEDAPALERARSVNLNVELRHLKTDVASLRNLVGANNRALAVKDQALAAKDKEIARLRALLAPAGTTSSEGAE